MSRLRDLPRAARVLIGVVTALGAGSIAIRLPEVGTWTKGDVLALAGLVVAGTLAEQFNISIRHRTETENFTLTDAVWVPALLLGKLGVLTFAVVLATVIGQALKRWAWYKIMFNTAQFAVAITAAESVHGLYPDSAAIGVSMWTSAILAMLAFFVVNEVVIAMIISAIEHEPLRRVLVLPAGLNLFHAAANITIGMVATLAWRTGPEQFPLLFAPVILSFLAYRGWFQANQEDHQAKELMRTVYEAGRALVGRVDESFDFQPFLDLVSRMVNASAVQLALLDGDLVRRHTLGQEATAQERDPDGFPADHFDPAPDDLTYVATIEAAGASAGALAVRRRPSLSPSEAALIDALASQLSMKLENRHLFLEAEQQRSGLADVIASSSDGIFVVDVQGRVLSWNPAMERIARVSSAGAIGKPVGTVLDARRFEGEIETDDAPTLALIAGETQAALIARPDGTERWIRYATNSMPEDSVDHGAFVVVARDVTADMEAERLKADFVATVSHELRTPLTPLKGILLTLRTADEVTPDETRREYYEIMLRQTERLERLIGDLLDASQLDAGRVPLEPSLVDLHALLREHVDDARRLPSAHQIDLVVSQEPAWVRSDPFRLGQVMLNLLSNAFKYSPADAPVRVVQSASASEVRIEVQDDGDGIPVDAQGRIFDRFYRIDSRLTRTTSGAGLGLYIAKRLLEQMGGTVTVRSAPGRGSTFVVTLPRIDQGLIDAMNGDRPRRSEAPDTLVG